MKDLKLDHEEKQLLDSFERGEWATTPNVEAEKARAVEAARQTLQALSDDQTVQLNLSEDDCKRLRSRAAQLGISYETLLSRVLHQYATEGLSEP